MAKVLTTIRISPELFERIKKMSRSQDRSFSYICEELMTQVIEKQETEYNRIHSNTTEYIVSEYNVFEERKEEKGPLVPPLFPQTPYTPPIIPQKEEKREAQKVPKVRKNASSAPKSFELTEEKRVWAEEKAAEEGLAINWGTEVEKFLDHHRAKGTLFKDWEAGWKTWVRNAVEFKRVRAGPAQPSKPSWMDMDLEAELIKLEAGHDTG